MKLFVSIHGTKVACGQGNCGACTVLVKHPDQKDAKPVNGCLFATGSLLVSEDSSASNMFQVTTIDGIKSKDCEHFVDAIVDTNGTQCGFCTAGMIMEVAGSAPKKGCSNVGDIEDLFNGNLCRCRGYRPIVYAAKKTYLSKYNLRLKEENGLSPPCVVREEEMIATIQRLMLIEVCLILMSKRRPLLNLQLLLLLTLKCKVLHS